MKLILLKPVQRSALLHVISRNSASYLVTSVVPYRRFQNAAGLFPRPVVSGSSTLGGMRAACAYQRPVPISKPAAELASQIDYFE